MANIQLLDQNTINKIAAGEVVERPSAVVKELVENAIDAGANAITCEIKEGGISLIRITDNGCGIEKDQIDTAFLRHATSKIRTVEDLLSVSSLGFRGEALASIASVSQVELVTKTPKDMIGVRYVIEGGEKKTCEDIGCPNGTTFIVRNLFYNTPARRKFLKSATTEAGYVNELVMRLAVSHPNVSFKLIVNNQIKLHTSGNNNMKDILYSIYGREIANDLLEVQAETADVKVFGFIGKPLISRGNRSYENFYINGRYIKSSLICKAIEEAYKPYIMQHKYPFTALHFQINPDCIDVNVHPTKLEVRFRNGEQVYRITKEAIAEALSTREMIPEISFEDRKIEKTKITEAPEPFEFKRMQKMNSPFLLKPPTKELKNDAYDDMKQEKIGNPMNVSSDDTTSKPSDSVPSIVQQLQQKREQLMEGMVKEKDAYEVNQQMGLFDRIKQSATNEETTQELPFLSQEAKQNHRIIGQLFATYWIVEFDGKMFIIDQHAAHEKILYEKTMNNVRNKVQLSQMIHPPIVLSFQMREEEVYRKYEDVFVRLGFEIEHFGGREYSIRAVPNDMLNIANEDLFLDLLDQLMEYHGERDLELVLEKVASMSCKAAIKGNQKISYEEASNLIDQLLSLENPYHCPHGRPVIVSMTKYEIEKKFKRII